MIYCPKSAHIEFRPDVLSFIPQISGVWVELVTLTCPPIKGDGACTLFDVRPNNPHVAIVGKGQHVAGLQTGLFVCKKTFIYIFIVWPDYDDPEWPRDYTSGLYKFTFHFNLSQANLPATMDNDLGYIQHSLVLVSVSNHKWRILDSKQVITLSGSNNLAMFPYQLIPPSVRVRQRKSKRDTSRTTWQHGPLSSPSSTTTGMEVLMQLTKQGFLPNDIIEGCIKIENPVRAVVKEIRVQVKYQTTSRQSSPTHSKSCIIARDRIAITDDGGAGSSSLTQLETFSLKLPPEMDPSWVTNDSTMTNVYAVHVGPSRQSHFDHGIYCFLTVFFTVSGQNNRRD